MELKNDRQMTFKFFWKLPLAKNGAVENMDVITEHFFGFFYIRMLCDEAFM